MTIQECYKKMGADYQEVLGRLYNEAMICKFVRMFLMAELPPQPVAIILEI